MPRWGWILLSFATIAVALFGIASAGQLARLPVPPDSIACTADAMVCPDGSSVGRVPPTCEFKACPGADTNATSSPTSIQIEAQINKSATALGIGILPLEVTEDSRCPVGVECVWAGTVRLKTRIHTSQQDQDIVLVLGTPQKVGSEIITLTEVVPANRAGVRISPSEYRFLFTIAKQAQ